MKNIFLAGAHTKGAPLLELVDEIRILEQTLRPLKERGLWALLPNRAANLDDVFDTFSREENGISIFHYAGHANQQELHFEGGGESRGIAELFGVTQNTALRFVFLNGCASSGHVSSLHAAGVGAVIATSRPVGDRLAREFAERFYQTWVIEGKTLEQAFQIAVALAHSKPGAENREILLETRSFGRANDAAEQSIPWGLYMNPQMDEEERQNLLKWPLNPIPQLAPLLLSTGFVPASESLMDLVFEFEQNDEDARTEIAQGQDPLLTLITRLPWTIGTHLRRLFAFEDSQSMSEPGRQRLNELVSGYTELTRFISYIALSALWDDKQGATIARERFADLQLIPEASESGNVDFISRLREYHRILLEIPGDAIFLEDRISGFLHTVDSELSEGYRYIEELKQALADPDPERLADLIKTRTGSRDGLTQTCLQTDAIFAGFLRAALFLTEYKLYTVRTIVVDKIRFLDLQSPFSHKTMTLHGAFSPVKLISTQRTQFSDNYSILLAPRKQDDPLANALNLSPFYIDKSAYLGDKTDDYPAIFVLKHHTADDEYVYEYLDGDVNHQYIFAEGHLLRIRKSGAVFPPALKSSLVNGRRFEVIHRQLVRLQKDFAL